MRVAQGTVVNGKIDLGEEDLTEGLVVTVLLPEDPGTFSLSPEAETELLAALEEADRGDLLSEEDLWRELGRR